MKGFNSATSVDSDSNPEQEAGEVLANQISKFVNGAGGSDMQKAVDVLAGQHRTLQQCTMKFFMMFIERMAGNTSDLRNEASVALAKKIVEATKQDYLPHI